MVEIWVNKAFAGCGRCELTILRLQNFREVGDEKLRAAITKKRIKEGGKSVRPLLEKKKAMIIFRSPSEKKKKGVKKKLRRGGGDNSRGDLCSQCVLGGRGLGSPSSSRQKGRGPGEKGIRIQSIKKSRALSVGM